ncbi:MAG: type I restriction endonuclease subunit R [Anaerolineae bacterium]|nr:type I restriction endonuclease subunit R [Anaerolineae bacterium]
MATKNRDNEDALESAVMDLFQSLGYEVINAYDEISGVNHFGRATLDEVVLLSRLYPVLQRLNPGVPQSVLETAVETLLADRSLSTLANANAQVYALLKNGVKVTFKDNDENDITETVWLIDWNNPDRNDWLAVRQFWVLSQSGLYKRRADVVLFVNGLPLGFVELKTFHRNVEHAFNGNLSDYKDTIPHLFWYNAFIILSNGRSSRIGSVTSSWEHFAEWKRISDEQEAERVSLETMLMGICEQLRLLDLVENFTLFKQSAGGLVKYIARNHQFLGVNNAIRAVQAIADNRGRLGVFWHTQGSGKSYSMVFFAQKVLRTRPGNWTFLIVTDRQELDDQIYQNFADVGAVPNVKGKQRDIQAQSGEDLKRLLQNDNRYVFTLIQKFHTRDGEPYPVLSERDDIIVMTDEAHRSQYDTFAANMRAALPNAAFIGFTGTPLMAGEEKTRQVFGEYVSIYDFKQSVDDGSTVPMYYENRIPKLQLTNEQLNDDMETLLDEAMLDDAQESKLEREFRQEYQIITREPRQDEIARDIVAHYMERGFAGRSYHSKAMVVCVDKLTAVRMYERVREYWTEVLAALETRLTNTAHPEERAALEAKCQFMRETDMAVVISQAQNEIEFFRSKGLDILRHRQRMVNEALDEKFKKPEDPLRLVFVCAMWMTGFDAPACATIYLDKPMRNHTLMQTIARANRVFRDKQDGLIVDYIGVFRNLEKALAIYGTGTDGTAAEGETPVQQKQARVNDLRNKIGEAVQFCDSVAIDLDAILSAEGFDRIRLKNEAVEALLGSQEITQRFFTLVRDVNRLFKSILPDRVASEFYITRKMLNILAEAVIEEIPDADISDVATEVAELLDESVITEAYIIEASPTDTSRRVDLSLIDFDALRERFEQGYKRTATERLRGSVNQRLQNMVRLNRTRMNYLETFQQMINAYNDGAVNVDVMFERLMAFVGELEAEEKRAIGEQLSEEELAIFDLLTRPALNLSDKERETVKRVAQQLLQTLKQEKLVLDWRKHQHTRAAVQNTINVFLDERLPDTYGSDLYEQKCLALYQHIYESYFGAGKSVYNSAA